MKNIISVSRRTDIPAFYGNWFINRIKDGYAGYLNPFNKKIRYVSLKREDVVAFVFWSKNYIPFYDDLRILKEQGYNFYYNYTINNFSKKIEPNVPDIDLLLENIKKISATCSPKTINWRYDPIIISDKSDFEFHLKNFNFLAQSLSGYVERCYMSFVHFYKKVRLNLLKSSQDDSIKVYDPSFELKVNLANELADIAERNNIKLLSRCSDYLINGKIKKGSCVDLDLINELFQVNYSQETKVKPMRKECGCSYSIDIGSYNTCIHGCLYCYANINKENAKNNFIKTDVDSPVLGLSINESLITDKNNLFQEKNKKQLNLFK